MFYLCMAIRRYRVKHRRESVLIAWCRTVKRQRYTKALTNYGGNMTEIINMRILGGGLNKFRYINSDGSPFTQDDLSFFYKKRRLINIFDFEHDRFDWVARNQNGSLSFFKDKPIKKKSKWYVSIHRRDGKSDVITTNQHKNLFPNIKWEDEEPINIWGYIDVECLPRNFNRKNRKDCEIDEKTT